MDITFPTTRLANSETDQQALGHIVEGIGADFYDNNIIYTLDRLGPRRYRLLLKVSDNRGAGAHRSADGWNRKGRRTPWACWHVHRDVLMEVFDTWPEASVRTAIATYRHREGFLQSFAESYYCQRGPGIAPSDYGDLCQCDGNRRAIHSRNMPPEPIPGGEHYTEYEKYGGFKDGVYNDVVNEEVTHG